MLIESSSRSVLNVVYKDIEGAEFRNVSGRQLYTLPCGQEFNLTFIFGGQKYPIRASDSNLSGSLLGLAKEDEDEICFGAVSNSVLRLTGYTYTLF